MRASAKTFEGRCQNIERPLTKHFERPWKLFEAAGLNSPSAERRKTVVKSAMLSKNGCKKLNKNGQVWQQWWPAVRSKWEPRERKMGGTWLKKVPTRMKILGSVWTKRRCPWAGPGPTVGENGGALKSVFFYIRGSAPGSARVRRSVPGSVGDFGHLRSKNFGPAGLLNLQGSLGSHRLLNETSLAEGASERVQT